MRCINCSVFLGVLLLSLIFYFLFGLNGAQAKVIEFKPNQGPGQAPLQFTWTLIEDGRISGRDFQVFEEGLRFFWSSLGPHWQAVYTSPEQLPEGGVDLVFLLQKSQGLAFDAEAAFTERLDSEGLRSVSIVHLIYERILGPYSSGSFSQEESEAKALAQVLRALAHQFFGWGLPGLTGQAVGGFLEAEVRASRESLSWLERVLGSDQQAIEVKSRDSLSLSLRNRLFSWYQEEGSRLLLRRQVLAQSAASTQPIPLPSCKSLLYAGQVEF